jgi:ABC-type uncharacterized transport system permease subunit
VAEVLFWPAVLAYGEAAFAYAGNVRRPGGLGRLATWGVRIGWLLQTALLVAQAVRAGRFPWDTWAGSLNLFVWLVVGAYLIWGCQTRYRLLGLTVMPLAAALLALAYAGGGIGAGERSPYSTAFLVLHVGLVLAAFAGFTLAAALAAVYLWQERRLKRRDAGILLVGSPSLVTLDRLWSRAIAISLPALTLGILVGALRLRRDGGGIDALMAVTVLTWAVYGGFLVARYAGGLHGRRAAFVVLAGFALVVLARLGLPVSHFS